MFENFVKFCVSNKEGLESLADFSTIVGSLVGALSLMAVAVQIVTNQVINNKNVAIDAHKEYLKHCIEMPEYSSSHLMLKKLNLKNFRGIGNIGSVETEKALWFFSYTLFAMEQLFLSNGFLGFRDRNWDSVVASQLYYNLDLLREVWPEYKAHYDSKFVSFVDQKVFDRKTIV